MSAKEPKRRSRHIQARLREDYVREADAVATYDWLKTDPDTWTDRLIITEALLALRKKLDKGYKPAVVESEITFTTEMRGLLKLIMEHVQMLSSIDLTAARQSPDWDEERYQDTTSKLNSSVVNLFGASKSYGDEDDD
jgi:hypothetical protein